MRKILTGAHGVAPARDQALGASRGTAIGKRHWLDELVEFSARAKPDQHDVIDEGGAAVARVSDDLRGTNVLLRVLGDSDVVLSQTYLDAPERLLQCIDVHHQLKK